MTETPTIRRVSSRSDEALAALRAYVAEMVERSVWAGKPEAVEDVDDFLPPSGGFIVALIQGDVVGCGAVRTLDPGIGELKRMWVSPERRRQGIGTALLHSLEQLSIELGHERLRLDSNQELSEAIALYVREGFMPTDRYNDADNATHFFEKAL